MVDEWARALASELGLDLDVDTALLLDVSREAAHRVTRPAAPVTTFLIGYAAARAGGDPAAVAAAAATARQLVEGWGHRATA